MTNTEAQSASEQLTRYAIPHDVHLHGGTSSVIWIGDEDGFGIIFREEVAPVISGWIEAQKFAHKISRLAGIAQ